MAKFFNYTLSIVLIVGLLAMTGDITLTWTSPMFEKLLSNDTSINPLGAPITPSEQSWLASLVNIGAMLGPLPFGLAAERLGRKPALLLLATPHLAAYLLFAFGDRIWLFYLGRLLGGVGLGAGYTLLPMYVAEIAQDSTRGPLSVALNCFWTLGNLLPFALGPYLPAAPLNLVFAAMPVLFVALFALFAQETPHFLIGAKRHAAGERALRRFRQPGSVKLELDAIEQGLEAGAAGHWSELFRAGRCLRALGVCLFLIVAQQLSGVNAILSFATEIFAEAGLSAISPDEASIVIGVVLFASSTITPFVVERLGRRLLLMVSALGMAVAHGTFGVYFYVKQSTGADVSALWWLPVGSLVCFIIMYNLGLGPLPWTLTAELFPGHVKSAAAALVSVTCWFVSFLITEFYEDMSKDLGEGETFWLFGGCCLVTVAFAFFFVPETRGKSFAEIQMLLRRNSKD